MKANHLTPKPIEKIAFQKVSFGFSEIRDVSFVKAQRDAAFFIEYIHRLKQLSNMTWDEIRTTHRHGFGSETIGVDKLTKQALQRVPFGLKKLIVLRATGGNHVFLGYRDGNVFQVLFIEYRFGDIYAHGA